LKNAFVRLGLALISLFAEDYVMGSLAAPLGLLCIKSNPCGPLIGKKMQKLRPWEIELVMLVTLFNNTIKSR
jgi:hypothetical protein